VLEPWPRLPISVGVGLGAGVARVEIAQRLAESSPTRVSYTPLLGARAQLAAAVLERADILFALSWSKALTDVPLARDGQHGAMLFTPSFDAMLGFDVHCF